MGESVQRASAIIEFLEGRLLLADRIHGIDVSQFQGVMNWDLAFNQNVRFTWVRASRSLLGADSLFNTNVPPAKARGILTGVYHHTSPVFNATDGTNTFIDPIEDAQMFFDTAFPYMGAGYLRPVVVLEEDGNLNQNGYNINTWAAAWVNKFVQLSGVVPVVYTPGTFAVNFLTDVVVDVAPDVWVAFHSIPADQTTVPITDPTSQPRFQTQILTGPWIDETPTPEESWRFWQYSGSQNNGKAAIYGAQSGTSIDLNVFNGDNINILKQNFVVGAAKIPTLLSPASGATDQPFSGLVLDWNDAQGAVAYDVYLDNMNTPAATNLAQSQWTVTTMLAGGSHTWRVVAKGVVNDDDTHVSTEQRTFSATPPPLPGEPANPNHNNVTLNFQPVQLNWDDAPTATLYDVYFGANPNPTFQNLTASQSPNINPLDGVIPWRVVAKNPSGSTNGPQWTFTMDRTAPTAAPGGGGVSNFGAPLPLSSNFSFNVTYSDVTSLVDVSTLGDNDVKVTGPNGFSEIATLVSVGNPSNGTPRTATYRINAPTGTWSRYDNGTYTVSQEAGSVRDTANNARAAGTIGTFNFTAPFAWKIGNDLHVEHGPQGIPINVSFVGPAGAGSAVQATEGATTLSFSPVLIVVVHGSSGDDTLQWNGSLSGDTFLLFDGGGGGNDEFQVQSGSMPLNTDYSATSPNLAVTVAAGAAAGISTRQRLRGLNIDGTLSFNSSGRDYSVLTRSLSIGPSGVLDVGDKDLIVDPAAGDPPITAADVQAKVASAHNGGAWDGFGIRTSMPDALTGLTTLGVAPASAVIDFGVGETATFSGHSVTTDAVLLKYTYAGDANLDGFISGDDYSTIDFAIAVAGASGYWNGDFNFDGIISGDDYSLIDFNIAAQGTVLNFLSPVRRGEMQGKAEGAVEEKRLFDSKRLSHLPLPPLRKR